MDTEGKKKNVCIGTVRDLKLYFYANFCSESSTKIKVIKFHVKLCLYAYKGFIDQIFKYIRLHLNY